MGNGAAALILDIAAAYGAAGLLVAGVFLCWGIERVDENARGAWAFRPLLVPGVLLLWPLVLWRWHRLSRGWDEARRHRPPRAAQNWIALAMALAIPAIIVVSLVARQNGPFERQAQQIAPPSGETGNEAPQ